MHTISVNDETGDERGRVHFNSDWSGDAVLDHDGKLVTFPAEVLRALAFNIVRRVLQGVAEDDGAPSEIDPWLADGELVNSTTRVRRMSTDGLTPTVPPSRRGVSARRPRR